MNHRFHGLSRLITAEPEGEMHGITGDDEISRWFTELHSDVAVIETVKLCCYLEWNINLKRMMCQFKTRKLVRC